MAEQRGPVLVATDLSPRSDRAVDRALMLGGQWQVQTCVLHALRPEERVAEDDVRQTLPADPGNVRILLPAGPAPDTIADVAQDLAPSLIVTGIARFNHLGDYFLGTAVDHIIRNAAAPVLVVKQRARTPYRRMLVAVDLSVDALRTLRTAGELFPQVPIEVVHAYHVPFRGWVDSDGMREELRREAGARLDEFLANEALPAALAARITPRLELGAPDEVLARAIMQFAPDLVVVGSRDRSGLAQATFGSNTSALLGWIAADTLVVKKTPEG
ncbi:universal stress protein [Novosphingobium sp. YAF33]|uniref:universal stress protein n=1 Tax=Novosphingobium sp. YAF33 TaxID=3233082 RepID=UPI003F9DD3C4